MDPIDCSVHAFHENAFSQFELERVRGQAGLRQRGLHAGDQSFVPEFLAGQIDGNLEMAETGSMPADCLVTGYLEQLAPHTDDLPGFFQHFQKLCWAEQAFVRVIPAYQRFNSMHPPSVQINLGLVVENELVPLLCVVQIGFQL